MLKQTKEGSVILWPGAVPGEDQASTEAERLAAEVEDLKCLHALSLRLTAEQSLTKVLTDVLLTASGLVSAPLGTIQLLTGEGALDMVGQVGFGERIISAFPTVQLEDCTTCSVALQKRSRVIVSNLRADPHFSAIAAALHAYGAIAAVSTPVLDNRGNVLAMFSLYWREQREPTERELRVLDLCAELAGRQVERSAAEARQRLLMRELAHRGRNLISVIQAIATRTLSSGCSIDEARETFIGRLQAVANTYDALTDEAAETTNLHNIVSAGLKSSGDRVSISGSVVILPSKTAQTLSLVVHELATNAAKYGALSVKSGRVDVAWRLVQDSDARQRFVFEWSERGGPAAAPPTRKGFGSVIISSFVGKELHCKPELHYAETGFDYRLECALSDIHGSEAGAATL